MRRWCGDDVEIEKVALEGEGKIDLRVQNLWQLLLNWAEHLRSAEVIILGMAIHEHPSAPSHGVYLGWTSKH